MKERFDKWVAQPRNRAVIWGAMGGLITAAGFMSNEIEEEMKENAETVEGLLEQYRSKSQKGKTQQIVEGKKPERQDISSEDITSKPIELGEEKSDGIPCLTIENRKKQCAKLKALTPDEQKELRSFGPGLVNLAQAGRNVGNGLNNTNKISSATLKGASSLAGKHAFAVKREAQAKKLLLKELNKNPNTGAAADFKRFDRGFKQFLEKNAERAFKKQGLKPGPLLASHKAGKSSTKKEDEKKASKPEMTKVASKGKSTGGGWKAKLGFGNSPGDLGLDFDDEEKKEKKKSKRKKKKKKKKFKISQKKIFEQGGINRNADANIFKAINLRYKKRFILKFLGNNV